MSQNFVHMFGQDDAFGQFFLLHFPHGAAQKTIPALGHQHRGVLAPGLFQLAAAFLHLGHDRLVLRALFQAVNGIRVHFQELGSQPAGVMPIGQAGINEPSRFQYGSGRFPHPDRNGYEYDG